MCGIFGIHSLNHPLEERILREALAPLSYRGPDDEGVFLTGDRAVGLAHKRLSIIDLSSSARQPMSDETGKYHIVFNGEIYNYRVLRSELELLGHDFITRSDTEVLIRAFIQWGSSCLSKINGMFAFAVHDEANGVLFLARDRMGKKPLYYAQQEGSFLFASEPKAIIASSLVEPSVDLEGVNWYFSLGYIPGSRTAFRHIRRLPPGHCLVYKLRDGSIDVTQYWDVPPQDGSELTEGQAITDIKGLLGQAVKSRLVSDVPLGAFLSGGIDSSLIVAMMRLAHDGDIMTFSVGFEGSSSSELGYAKEVAGYFDTKHTEISVAPRFRDDLEHISEMMDEPVYDNSILPTYYLSRETRRFVTVALSGDGGDELFGGYIHYGDALRTRRLASHTPGFLRPLAGALAAFIPRGAFGRNTLDGIAGDMADVFVYPTELFSGDERLRLLTEDTRSAFRLGAPGEYRRSLLHQRGTFVNGMCYADMKTLLVDDILLKVDRASMFNSLEVRCPFLDHALVEYAFSRVPDELKIRNGVKKYLLKRLALHMLPKGLELERKQGFSIPADVIDMDYVGQRIMDFPPNQFIKRRELEALVTGRKNPLIGRKLFALYFFHRWLEKWAG